MTSPLRKPFAAGKWRARLASHSPRRAAAARDAAFRPARPHRRSRLATDSFPGTQRAACARPPSLCRASSWPRRLRAGRPLGLLSLAGRGVGPAHHGHGAAIAPRSQRGVRGVDRKARAPQGPHGRVALPGVRWRAAGASLLGFQTASRADVSDTAFCRMLQAYLTASSKWQAPYPGELLSASQHPNRSPGAGVAWVTRCLPTGPPSSSITVVTIIYARVFTLVTASFSLFGITSFFFFFSRRKILI